MIVRLMAVLFAVMAVSGCATTQPKVQPVSPIETKVADLSQRVDEQEKEIVDLKYSMKEMSDKVENKEWDSAERRSVATTSSAASSDKGLSSKSADKDGGLLRVAASGEQVQKALKNAGLYDGKVDGKIGPRTKSAIMEFQKQHNLKADGVIGQKTWNELKQYLSE